MKKIGFICTLAVAFFIWAPFGVQAEDERAKVGAVEKTARGERDIAFAGCVASVDEVDKTFTVQQASGNRVLLVTKATKIENLVASGKQVSTIEDVVAGSYVTGLYGMNRGKLEVHSLQIGKLRIEQLGLKSDTMDVCRSAEARSH